MAEEVNEQMIEFAMGGVCNCCLGNQYFSDNQEYLNWYLFQINWTRSTFLAMMELSWPLSVSLGLAVNYHGACEH